MHDSAELNCSEVIRPARTSSDIFHTEVPEPRSSPWNLPLSIGPPDSPIVGRSQLAADRLLDIHAGEISKQHRGRAKLGLAERHHGKFERETAGFVNATLHELRELAEVTVAGRELRPGIADADDGAPVEQIF